MTATAFSAIIPGVTDISSLYFTLINAFLGSLAPSLTTGSTMNGTQANWFVPVAGYTLPTPTGGASTICAFLSSAAPVDNFLQTDSSQTYNILLKYVNTTSDTVRQANPQLSTQSEQYTAEIYMYYGTNNNFTMAQDFQANDIVVNVDCPSVQICGSGIVKNGAGVGSGNAAGANVSKPSIANPGLLGLTFTPRGFALNFWLYAGANNCFGNSMLVIQRPVNPTTGVAHTAGDAPIFSLARNYTDYGIYTGWGVDATPPVWNYDNPTDPFASDNRADYSFWFSVIRSAKTSVSAKPVSTNSLPVSSGNYDVRPSFYRWGMDWNHANLYDNFSNVIKFMYGFFTTYHLYLDEMDLVCLVNALAFTNKQPISITMYGEASARTYTATYGDSNATTVTVDPQNSWHSISTEVSCGARLGILFDSTLHH
jgi:hypothetical protein